jgi:putative oxygen-independent coproporphyrinogen III oxidase
LSNALPEPWQEAGFGLYVHWPFCQSKCPYCDFNSHVAEAIDQEIWISAYLAEIKRISEETGPRPLRSIFFGGGTPSLMRPEVVGGVIAAAAQAWSFTNDIEITLEANPTSVEAVRFAGYAAGGVNRVSLGVQALNDSDLRALGRLHNVDEALHALDVAREHFARVSFDLIYARQDQTPEAWRDELARALSFGTDHLSLYQLTIEEGTPFARRAAAGGLRGLPGEDLSAEMFDLTQEMTAAAGLPAYEISNHARPGAGSRHNLIYWRSGDFAGIGPGAHGRLTLGGRRLATESPKAPADWLRHVRAGNGETPRESLGLRDQAEEYAMMSLRLTEGMSCERFAAIGGEPLDFTMVSKMEALGVLLRDGDRIVATLRGRPILNAVLRELLA